ncbi:MAG: IreB family regulatory phosphoprotein [Lachnospiraceae bacterium]|nr:IreB family regulatory phosphoprotein [Lachnospiraceae bacterium]MBR5739173.1 IreB family regulatory phosphoprotein [Lachnospiraceae bacterium]
MANVSDTQFIKLPFFEEPETASDDYDAADVLKEVYAALKEKGYNPETQIVGYIMSGDPTYITNHKGARALIRKVERDELLSELVQHYIETKL